MPWMAAVMLTGCASVNYETAPYDVLRPAIVTLPQWVDTIVMATMTTPQYAEESIDHNASTVAALAAASQKQMPRKLCRAVAEELNESGYLAATTEIIDLTETSVRAARIDSVLRGHPGRIILALDQLIVNSGLSLSEHEDEESETKETCVTLTCATTSHFSLLSSTTTSNPLDTRNDTLFFMACGGGVTTMVSKLPNVSQKYEEVAAETGRLTADMLIPTWEKVRRYVYVTNTKSMMSAASWVEQDNWEEARKFWNETILTSKKETDKVRACLNMAVSYEREDDIASAALWCSKALDRLESIDVQKSKLKSEYRMAKNMFNYLMERADEKEILDKQMN